MKLEFRNDITPEDLRTIRQAGTPRKVIAYGSESPEKPFIVELFDSDQAGWYQGMLYTDLMEASVYSTRYRSEWPSNWYWAEWDTTAALGALTMDSVRAEGESL